MVLGTDMNRARDTDRRQQVFFIFCSMRSKWFCIVNTTEHQVEQYDRWDQIEIDHSGSTSFHDTTRWTLSNNEDRIHAREFELGTIPIGTPRRPLVVLRW